MNIILRIGSLILAILGCGCFAVIAGCLFTLCKYHDPGWIIPSIEFGFIGIAFLVSSLVLFVESQG